MNRCLALKVSRQDHVLGIIKGLDCKMLATLVLICFEPNKKFCTNPVNKTFLECRNVQEV